MNPFLLNLCGYLIYQYVFKSFYSSVGLKLRCHIETNLAVLSPRVLTIYVEDYGVRCLFLIQSPGVKHCTLHSAGGFSQRQCECYDGCSLSPILR